MIDKVTMKARFKTVLDVQATFNYSMLKTYQKEILQRRRNYAKEEMFERFLFLICHQQLM